MRIVTSWLSALFKIRCFYRENGRGDRGRCGWQFQWTSEPI